MGGEHGCGGLRSACGELIGWEWESAAAVMLTWGRRGAEAWYVESGLEYKAEVRTAEVGSEVRLK